jgi:hypothetical protein
MKLLRDLPKQPAGPITDSIGWHGSSDLRALLDVAAPATSLRKLHLFACAALRTHSHDELLHDAASLGEALADAGMIDDRNEGRLARTRRLLQASAPVSWRGGTSYRPLSVHTLAQHLLDHTFVSGSPETGQGVLRSLCGLILRGMGKRTGERLLAGLLRDIVGDPFAPATVRPEWLTGTGHLARALHAERNFGDAPLLADALIDAGCESGPVLEHLQGPGPHVAGCWAVDLLAGAW